MLRYQVSGLSMSLLGCFAVFCACVGPLMQLYGTSGLVMANCLGTSNTTMHFVRINTQRKRTMLSQ
jgi:hypothetical protein